MTPTPTLVLVPCSAIGPRKAAIEDAVTGELIWVPRAKLTTQPDGLPFAVAELLFTLGRLTRCQLRGERKAFWVRSSCVVPSESAA